MLGLIVGILLFSYVLERYLDWLNLRNWTDQVPEQLQGVYDNEEYGKAQRYDRAKTRLRLVSSTFGTFMLLIFLLSGSFALVDKWASLHGGGEVGRAILFFFVLALVADILQTPFSLYKTFVIEEQFGFNRSTLSMWLSDKLKGYLLAGLLGGSLLAMFVMFYEIAGENFWWIAWICLSAVSILLGMFYTSVILPLFNKLSPLPDGKLRTMIENYCNGNGFPLSGLFVIDGSKRSSKANAFFSGLGPKKKIVLFDTLIENHREEELVAVMAHEVGHYKKRHTLSMMFFTILQTGIMLFFFSRLAGNPALAEALGASVPSLPLAMLAFMLLYSPVSMIMGIIINAISRKHEFEADTFAARTFSADALKEALKKLSRNNLSNLQPHHWYIRVYYSHPTLLQRLQNLDRIAQRTG